LRVPLVVQRSVAFIGEAAHVDSSGISGDLLATGFFVCVPFMSPDLAHKRCGFFVTAAHVAKDLHKRTIYFVVNKKYGGVTGIKPIGEDWWTHPKDRSADVVAIPVELNREADMSCVATKDFVMPIDFAADKVGVGDEIFITGLFTAVPGISRAMPIVRHGNIAMLPEEQIQTEMGYADVHLVEARSIGGLSGSPVFVRTADAEKGSHKGVQLLGVMHGHWDVKESELNNPTINHDKRGVNYGIGIVTPAIKIMEIIDQPDGLEWRQEMEDKLLKDMTPGTDSARRKDETDEPFAKADFEAALDKVSRKITPKE
jgi:hypothetical protein